MPLNLMVTINNSATVTLSWDEPEMANGIIRNYIINVLDDDMSSVLNVTVSNLTFVIMDLTPNTDYIVNISAVTIRSGDVTSITFTTPTCKHIYYCNYVMILYI